MKIVGRHLGESISSLKWTSISMGHVIKSCDKFRFADAMQVALAASLRIQCQMHMYNRLYMCIWHWILRLAASATCIASAKRNLSHDLITCLQMPCIVH